MIPEAGRRFGPYEIQSRLGGGGMGHVFRAWDARLHREVAIKLLNNEYVMPGMRERFLREARAASGLNHANICTVFDIGEQDGEPYLVMELLHGETLRDRIQRQTIPIDDLVAVARESAEALGAAHAKGVVHRDVKPANIFLVDKPNGGLQAKVLDFGLAKIDGGVLGPRGRSLELTTVGATVGTLAYMSPEQARGEVLDARSDLFSLGVVMYEMATRQVPFKGATSALIFVQLLNHPPEPVREWNDSIPRDLEKIILKLLAKDRNARFQTARELELALIALNEKGSGGWLRKAVTAVPLVRAPDPVARERRPPRLAGASASGIEPVRPSSRSGVDRERRPSPEAAGASSDDAQVLRPVVRAPRSDGLPPQPRPAPSHDGPQSPGQFTTEPAEAPVRNSPVPPGRGSAPEIVTSLAGQAEAHPDPEVSADMASREPLLGPPVTRRVSLPWDIDEEFDDESPELLEPRTASLTRFRWLIIAGIVVLAGLAALVWARTRSVSPVVLVPRGAALIVTGIENQTGNRSLDGAVAEGLELDLAESPYFQLRQTAAYHMAYRMVAREAAGKPGSPSTTLARRAAERMGARAYVSGTVSGTSPPYRIRLDLREVATDNVLSSADVQAASLQEIPGAIDDLADTVRVSAGESRASINLTKKPLAQEATGNLEALQSMAQGQSLLAEGRSREALDALQRATVLDPRFSQAHRLRAGIFMELHAELAAEDSARLALAASDSASSRTRILAQAAYEMDGSGDLPRATTLLRTLLSTYPRDEEALTMYSAALRREDHFTDALQAAEEAYGGDIFASAATAQLNDALLSLARYDRSFQITTQMRSAGLPPDGASLLAASLDGHEDVANLISTALLSSQEISRADWSEGAYLDNTGRLTEGAQLWRSQAAEALRTDSLRSAAAFLLAQAAVNRALLGECPAALGFAHDAEDLPLGRVALFNMGITYAFCGQAVQAQHAMALLEHKYPQSFEVTNFYLGNLHSALALHEQDADAAIDAIRAAHAFDLVSITPLLRARADIQLRQTGLGIVDLQIVLSHEGSDFLSGSTLLPAAQLDLARAFSQTGDQANSAEAYRKFLNLWHLADANDPLVIEARRHLRSNAVHTRFGD